MTASGNAEQRENVYFIDPESATEMARLMNQGQRFTRGMGGLFSEREGDISGVSCILDIGCGPGEWVLDVAYMYPDVEVVGIDISRTMIEYATAQAHAQRLNNVRFLLMDATKPLALSDASFDLVNARTIAFLPPAVWPQLLRECMRVLRPGGTVRLTETEWGFSNSPAYERMASMFYQALHAMGQSFSPDGRRNGITTMLGGLLKDVGCQNIKQVAHVIDFSSGTEEHEGFYKDALISFKLVQPFFMKARVATSEEFDQIYNQMLIEAMMDNFRAIMFLLTAWGEKP